MAFPEKTWLRRPYGWKNLGPNGETTEQKDGKMYNKVDTHTFCGSILNIGKERDLLFKYCPRCMVKTK